MVQFILTESVLEDDACSVKTYVTGCSSDKNCPTPIRHWKFWRCARYGKYFCPVFKDIVWGGLPNDRFEGTIQI
jgi:hypothetical protein